MLQYRKSYEVANRYITRETNALDWGCGNGHFSYFLTLQKIPTTGFSFDSIPVFLKDEPLFSYVNGIPSEPTLLPFPESTFDIVFSVGVLEHVYETGGSEEKSLKEIYRILRPGGLFICYHFPNRYQWIEPLARLLGLAEHFHTRKYTKREIQQLVQQTGFYIVEIGRYNFFPRNQLRFLPGLLTHNSAFIYTFEFLDQVLSYLLPTFCTNYYFVARVTK